MTDINITTKICPKCKRELDVGRFSKNTSAKDGLQRRCKDCASEYGRKRFLDKKDDLKKYQKEYYENNKDEKKKYRENNKDKKREYDKLYYEINKNKKKKYSSLYYIYNINKVKEYREANKDKIKERKKEYNKDKALFSTYFVKLTVEEDPISDNEGYLQVRCTHCKEYFYPTNLEVQHRIRALNGTIEGECRLYCSDTCKHSCPLYKFKPGMDYQPGTKEWEERQNKEPDRDPVLQADWHKMILERDGYKCVKCGVTENLTAHHVEGIHWNPLESLDLDVGVTLCESCNRKAHSIEGCTYYDMQCK